ncbi:MAG: hypothetical protein LBB45_04830 [Methanobrevibacter sp.]|nr:hypothetical protein [Candidatus Methanovirga basalitermitum]
MLKLDGNNSLIQNTYKLLQKVAKDIFIVSEKSHATEMLKQLNGFDKDRMIIEPCRKGTTNCTLLAARHIKNYFNNKKDDDRILFIHADHIFDDEKKFISSIKQAFSIKDKGVIIIGGKKPTYSGVKYGYVQTTKINNHLYKVIKFHEKPSLEVAKTLYKKPNYF